MITFNCIIRPAPLGAGRTTPSQPGHYPLIITCLCGFWREITSVLPKQRA